MLSGLGAILAVGFLGVGVRIGPAQNDASRKPDVMVVPDIAIQTEDYAEARKHFRTKLVQPALLRIKRIAITPLLLWVLPNSISLLADYILGLG